MDLSTATPVEIDTQIAAIYVRYYEAERRTAQQVRYRDDYAKGVERAEAGDFRYLHYTRDALAQREAAVIIAQEAAANILRETAPFNEEFKRRGGWTRAYLVDNRGGHVHNSMGCSTCFPTTEFVWLPEFSGKDETQVVEAAGEQACTVCFPSAPVDVLKRKSTIESPARKVAREEREAKKAAAHAKKVAKALYADDPERYLTVRADDRFPERLRTISAAKTFLTDGYDWGWGHPMYSEADRDLVAEVLAERLGTDPFTERAAAEKRAAKRR